MKIPKHRKLNYINQELTISRANEFLSELTIKLFEEIGSLKEFNDPHVLEEIEKSDTLWVEFCHKHKLNLRAQGQFKAGIEKVKSMMVPKADVLQ